MRATTVLVGWLMVSVVAACSGDGAVDAEQPLSASEVITDDDAGRQAHGASEGSNRSAGESGAQPQQGSGAGDGSALAHADLLDVDARALDGSRRDLSEYVGRPVALWMWAPW